jgi:nucleoside-triphosphatase THEP1
MVNVITGEINSGKTSRLLSLYGEINRGDGFYCRKKYIANHYAGQEIIRLTNGESACFSFKQPFIPAGWDEVYSYEDYSFSRTGLLFVNKIAMDIVNNKNQPVFIDEIGPLELADRGFHEILNQFLFSETDLYLVIRASCLTKVINKYHIDAFRVI